MKTSIICLESLIPVEHEDHLLDESIFAEAREKLAGWIKDPLHILDFAIQETIADEKPKYAAQDIVATSQTLVPDRQLALFPGIEPTSSLSIKEMAMCDQPAYRVLKDPLGVSVTELLAVILGAKDMSMAMAVQKALRGNPARLVHIDPSELKAIQGLGDMLVARLKAVAAFANRIVTSSSETLPTINSPADAAFLVQYEMSGLEQEHLRVLLLDTRNHVLDIVEVYRGSVNSSQVRVGEIFKAAVRRNSTAVIVVHNHPSGDPTPSPDDVAVTRAFVQAGKLLDVEVLDHLVIGQGKWVSLKERGLGFI